MKLFGSWEGKGKKAIEDSFSTGLDTVEIIVGVYNKDYYDGSAWVLGIEKKTGKLFEVYGSHCSCFGLETQWQPEITTLKYLKERFESPDRVMGHQYVPMTFEVILKEIKATVKKLKKADLTKKATKAKPFSRDLGKGLER